MLSHPIIRIGWAGGKESKVLWRRSVLAELRSEIAEAKQRHDQIEASEKVLKGRINDHPSEDGQELAQFEASRA